MNNLEEKFEKKHNKLVKKEEHPVIREQFAYRQNFFPKFTAVANVPQTSELLEVLKNESSFKMKVGIARHNSTKDKVTGKIDQFVKKVGQERARNNFEEIEFTIREPKEYEFFPYSLNEIEIQGFSQIHKRNYSFILDFKPGRVYPWIKL